jgi:glucose/arabinose dehydrogenase
VRFAAGCCDTRLRARRPREGAWSEIVTGTRRIAGLSALAIAAAGVPPARAEVREPGFSVATLAEGLEEPTALEFAPDGRLFAIERAGRVRLIVDGVLQGAPVAAVEVVTENENGLLGLALSPDFARDHYLYVFATVSIHEQQIIRFTEVNGVGVDPVVIRDHLPTRGEFHSGGGLKFGPDGKLYFGIGDNLVPQNAQDFGTLAGKISRINPDGSVPPDNPFRTPTGTPRSIYALGFRNPFRFCFAPDGRLFVLDVGSDGDGRREEVNLVRAGDNCGWPLVEGRQPPGGDAQFVDPILDYHDGGAAPVGAVYYTGENFPDEYRGNLFHLEYVLNRLYRTVLDGDAVVRHTVFWEGDGGPVDLTQGPDGALYFCELHTGRVRRLAHEGGPSVVVAAAGTDNDPADSSPVPAFSLCGAGAANWLCAVAIGLLGRVYSSRVGR